MLTKEQVQGFQQFQTTIAALLAENLDQLKFIEKLRSLHKIFQTEIQPIQSDNYQTHSVLVEINKQMRLLQMDGMFLQTARRSETVQSRIGQVLDRAKLLTQYCAVILATEPD